MTGGSYDISIWLRNTMISMSLSVSVRREDRSRPRIRHRPRQQRVKATADHGRWWRTLPAQSSDRGFGALHLPAVTLTTFRDVPWNAPFYARLGFRVIEALSPGLQAIRDHERDIGDDAFGSRVAMQIDLRGGAADQQRP